MQIVRVAQPAPPKPTPEPVRAASLTPDGGAAGGAPSPAAEPEGAEPEPKKKLSRWQKVKQWAGIGK